MTSLACLPCMSFSSFDCRSSFSKNFFFSSEFLFAKFFFFRPNFGFTVCQQNCVNWWPYVACCCSCCWLLCSHVTKIPTHEKTIFSWNAKKLQKGDLFLSFLLSCLLSVSLFQEKNWSVVDHFVVSEYCTYEKNWLCWNGFNLFFLSSLQMKQEDISFSQTFYDNQRC